MVNGSANMAATRLVITELPPGPNSSGRGQTRVKGLYGMHWTDRQELFDRWIWLMKVAVSQAGHPSFDRAPVVVTVTRYSTNFMDWDNFGASLKPVLDALVKCGVIADDNPEVIVSLSLRRKRSREQKLVVHVRAATPAEVAQAEEDASSPEENAYD